MIIYLNTIKSHLNMVLGVKINNNHIYNLSTYIIIFWFIMTFAIASFFFLLLVNNNFFYLFPKRTLAARSKEKTSIYTIQSISMIISILGPL
jgi:hypothetical protein